MRRLPMTTIAEGADCITLINIFTVDPDKQNDLVRLLDEATEKTMRNRHGFISANIHASLDGRHVANYAQWRSRKDFETMMADPEANAHMAKAGAMSEKFEPVLYEVASVV